MTANAVYAVALLAANAAAWGWYILRHIRRSR